MTPKEKAKELVDKYWGDSDLMIGFINSKKCSLIAVDEMIEYLTINKITGTIREYWEEVITEIEKL